MNLNSKKLLEAKMLLDTFEVPKRPMTLSSHQFKKKFGSNQGYSDYKKQVKLERRKWDTLYKTLQKNIKKKNKYLAEIDLSDEAAEQAEMEAERDGSTISEVLSRWLEKGRKV
jgi:hypothetical protein